MTLLDETQITFLHFKIWNNKKRFGHVFPQWKIGFAKRLSLGSSRSTIKSRDVFQWYQWVPCSYYVHSRFVIELRDYSWTTKYDWLKNRSASAIHSAIRSVVCTATGSCTQCDPGGTTPNMTHVCCSTVGRCLPTPGSCASRWNQRCLPISESPFWKTNRSQHTHSEYWNYAAGPASQTESSKQRRDR